MGNCTILEGKKKCYLNKNILFINKMNEQDQSTRYFKIGKLKENIMYSIVEKGNWNFDMFSKTINILMIPQQF